MMEIIIPLFLAVLTVALLLTVGEVAVILRVDCRSVHKWLRSRELEAIQGGRSWRIPRTSIVPNYTNKKTGQ
jgi:excisionase family DNA binding protein